MVDHVVALDAGVVPDHGGVYLVEVDAFDDLGFLLEVHVGEEGVEFGELAEVLEDELLELDDVLFVLFEDEEGLEGGGEGLLQEGLAVLDIERRGLRRSSGSTASGPSPFPPPSSG